MRGRLEDPVVRAQHPDLLRADYTFVNERLALVVDGTDRGEIETDESECIHLIIWSSGH